MGTDFRLSRLSIRGFRGIPELDLNLPERMPVYVIGGNNSGKSTVLDATALALSGGGFHNFSPDKFDYYHDKDNKPVDGFTVAVHFNAPSEEQLPAVKGSVGNPTPVYGAQARATTNRRGGFSHSNTLIDKEGANIALNVRMSVPKGQREIYGDRENLKFQMANARLRDLEADAPEVMYLQPHNLQDQLYKYRTGPLQRLSRKLAHEFNETSWSYTVPDTGKKWDMPGVVIRAHSALRAAVSQFPFWKDDLKPKLQDALSSYLGRQAKVELQPDIQEVEAWLTQQLVASFASDAGGAITPLQSMGDGWQSLVRLAALDVLSQYPEEFREHVVLLFEEPETHLHPHLRRKLRDVLERLAANGWTVIAATHSPEFVSFSRPQKIVRLWRIGDEINKADFDASATPDEVSLQDKLDERGNHEFLFAQRAVFCEGKDDVLALRILLTKLQIDLDALGISFVDIGGVGSHASYAEIASKLGIPWCAMTDQDLQEDGTVKPMTQKSRERLDQLKTASDLTPMWKPRLEECLGLAKGRGTTALEYLRTTIEPMAISEIKFRHPDYTATCDQVANWLKKPPPK